VFALGARTFIHSGRRGRSATGRELSIEVESRGEAYPEGMLTSVAVVVLVKGMVTIGPVTPVCRVGVPCDRPAANVVLVFTGRGRVVRTRTDGAGHFLVRLRPGRYEVDSTAGMRILPSEVAVRTGMKRPLFAIDTGIR
jgi:hypothetical protein